MKRYRILFASLFFIVGASVILINCNKQNNIDPNIISAELDFDLPENAEARFNELVTKTELEKIFIKDTINRFYPGSKWVGRVKDRGVSYQALFSIDETKIVYNAGNPEQRRLNFSIYNPPGSKLFYRVYLEDKTRKKRIYSGYFKEQRHISSQVNLDPTFKKDSRIVFETRGKGIGAWVNPRFVKKSGKSRVFVIIVLDTLRYDHTSLYGYKRKTTPHFEALALDGRVFRNAYSSTCWTLPAHVSLFSGKDLVRHRVATQDNTIPDDYPLIAEVFQKNGFVTAAFTGGGFVNDHYGFHRGFQYYSNLPGRVFNLNSAETVLQHFKNYIETYWGEDLFVFLHTYQVHAPYKFPPKYVRHFNKDLNVNLKGPGNFIRDKKTEIFKPLKEEDRQTLVDLYDTAIYYADEALVGGVIRYLKDKGVYDRAMLVVTSDHGEEFYDHGSWEHGHTLYNELIKIPLVIKYPGNRKKGNEKALASFTDIAGMMLQESGLPYEAEQFPVHIGETDRVLPVLFPHSPIIRHIPPKVSFVNDTHHFIYNMIDPEEMKVFDPQPRDPQVYELYALKDIKETINLAKKESKALREFRTLLKKYLKLLRSMKGKTSKMDKNLERELKSLGYLKD